MNEAAAEARRIDQSSPQRAQALTAIATRLLLVDRGQAWETMTEAVKVTGYAEDFKGEDGRVTAHLRTGTYGGHLRFGGAELRPQRYV